MTSVLDDRILSAADKLEPLPSSVLEVLATASDPDSGAADLGAIVSMDEGLFGRVLADANSASRASTTPIGTANSAVAYIGPARVIHLALLTVTNSTMGGSIEAYDMKQGELSSHAQLTATAAEIVRRDASIPLTLEVITCGLLHDIGKVVIDMVLGANAEELREAMRSGTPTEVAEHELFGLDHCDVSRTIADGWGLPKEIGDAIQNHHQPSNALGSMAHAVTVADGLAHETLDRSTGTVAPDRELGDSVRDFKLARSMAALQLDLDKFESMVDATSSLHERRNGAMADA